MSLCVSALMVVCIALVCAVTVVTHRCISVSVGVCALLLFAGVTWQLAHTVKRVHVCSYVCLGLCVLSVCVGVWWHAVGPMPPFHPIS